MLAGQKLKVAANTVQQSGTVSAKGSAAITARDSLVNRAGGSISSDNGLTIKTAQLTNKGTLSAAQLGLESDAITNAGLMQGTQSLSLLSNSLDNQAQGLLLSDEEMQLSAAQLDNAGQLVAGKLTLTGDLLNNSGKVRGGSLLDVQTKTLNNLSGSVMLSGVKAEISADTLSNHGQIQADELTLNAQTFTNEGEWTAKNLQITGGSLDNNGTVNGVDSLTAQLTGKLTQQQNKTLQSGGLLTLGAKEFDNHGRIQGSTLQLNGDTLSNSGWLQATSLILNVAKAGNTGTLLAEQQATLTGDTLTSSGTIQANTLTADYQ
ncbi:hypothetical protein [Erwinia sp. V71]|uniref:hypothetical protein n=1 Tax=Erwinia sp. V71 TaxID=3369424 RepID=UPI003F61318A